MNEESLRLYESIGFMKKAKTGHGRKPIPSDPFAFSLSLLVNSVTLITEFENCPFFTYKYIQMTQSNKIYFLQESGNP